MIRVRRSARAGEGFVGRSVQLSVVDAAVWESGHQEPWIGGAVFAGSTANGLPMNSAESPGTGRDGARRETAATRADQGCSARSETDWEGPCT